MFELIFAADMRALIFSFFFLLTAVAVAQDSITPADTIITTDSLQVGVNYLQPPLFTHDSARMAVIQKSFLQCYPKGWFFFQRERAENGKEMIFYALLMILLGFGILRLSYPRYAADMFRFYFQSTFRINQIREQLSHSVFAGALFSLLFFFGAGLYLYLLAGYYKLSFSVSFVNLPFVSVAVILVVYAFKFLFIRFFAWSFEQVKAGRQYLFITFLTNKILGVLLLPFLIMIAFGTSPIQNTGITLSVSLVLSLFVYRFFRAYQLLQAESQIGLFPYLTFLLAAELAPLLLIYKLLIQYL